MTATNDSDRIIRAWLEAMPEEAPDRAVHAVLEAVETVPQRRPVLNGPWRDQRMPRLLFAGLAAVLVVALGVALLGRTTSQSGIGTTPTPVPSIGPSASATPPPTASQAVSDVPAVLRQDWEADVASGDLPALGDHETQIQLSFGFDTSDEWIQTGFGPMSTVVQRSSASADGPDGVRLVSTETPGGCARGDDARYRWTTTGNGLFLTLTAVSDPCASRRSTLERTWVHSLGARNLGGPGVLSDLHPNIQVTLPAASWSASGETGAANVESDSNQFVAIKDPAGFSAPCSADGGRHISEPSTIAGYTAYIQSIAGFHVTSTNATIGGKPAVHLVVTTAPQPNCAAKIFEFAPNKLASSGGWFITPGDTDTVWLVQVGKDLYLLQWLGNGVTLADEQSVLATVQFIDKLPTP